jgi:hypothetical protein
MGMIVVMAMLERMVTRVLKKAAAVNLIKATIIPHDQ